MWTTAPESCTCACCPAQEVSSVLQVSCLPAVSPSTVNSSQQEGRVKKLADLFWLESRRHSPPFLGDRKSLNFPPSGGVNQNAEVLVWCSVDCTRRLVRWFHVVLTAPSKGGCTLLFSEGKTSGKHLQKHLYIHMYIIVKYVSLGLCMGKHSKSSNSRESRLTVW